MTQIKVSDKRHLAKTISYRVMSSLIGFLVIWMVSGNITVGAAFGVVELLYKPIQYFLHEKFWHTYVKYGLVKIESEPPKEVVIDEPKEEQKTKRLVYTKKTN